MMKISVVVPVYNVENYIQECVQSVLNQTYKNFEIILIDDGSTDGTSVLCDRLMRENPDYIRVSHCSNQGPLAARIEGINKAKGNIVLFLDGDDTYRKDALEKVVECFQKQKCDLVLFDTGESSQYPSISIEQSLKEDTVYAAETKKVLYSKLITYQIPNSVCLKAIKRDCIKLEHYPAQIHNARHGEDLLMSAYFITDCKSVFYLKEGLYHYRARVGSAIHSFDIQRKESIKFVHTELEKCIDQWGMPELKPIHNARKVQGWIGTLLLLLRNRCAMTPEVYWEQLKSMANDPYFRTAYANMDKSNLLWKQQLLAWLLYYSYAWLRCFERK
jgi:glycosyltransferase involved in cell wall biosynthesis